MHGSAVWAGAVRLEDGYALADVSSPSTTTRAELERIGYLGPTPCSHSAVPLGAHFELHIEQGPILEREGKRVGVVRGGQAYRWFELTVDGRDSHAGTTPLDARADAMLCAARIISAAHDVAAAHSGLATTGMLSLQPGSVNTSARTVSFSLDIRHMQDAELDKMEAQLRQTVDDIARGPTPRTSCSVTWKALFRNDAVQFDPACIEAVREAAEFAAPGSTRDIYSGAGHDSCLTAMHVPTGMIFIPVSSCCTAAAAAAAAAVAAQRGAAQDGAVLHRVLHRALRALDTNPQCKDGLSHNPEEYSTPEDCATGAQVLLDAVLAFDSRRTE